MNHFYKPILIGLLSTGSIFSAQSKANPTTDTLHLSLGEIWQKADAYSRAVHVQEKAFEVSTEHVRDAEMERYPDINVTGSLEETTNIPIYEHGIFNAPVQHDVIHSLYQFGTDFYLNVYSGNKLNLKIAQEKILHKMASIKKDQAFSDVHYSAASSYLELQRSMVFRDLVRQSIIEQRTQLEEIKTYHKEGVVLKSDVLRLELDLSRKEMTLITIQNDILIANQKLNILIGLPDDEPVVASTTDNPLDNKLPEYNECLALAMQQAFSYRLSAQQTELSRIHVRQEKAEVMPKLGFFGSFNYADPQILLYPYNPYWYSLGIAGIKASFPISSLYHNVHKIRAANLKLEEEEEAHKEVADRVRQAVKEAYLRYKEALLQIDVSRANVAHAKENARIIRNSYFSQTSLITDLLDADLQVLQSGFELESARIMALNKYYLLQSVIGTL